MVKKDFLYKCNKCGNIVSVLDGSNHDLICCGEVMKEIPVITANEGLEKHKPVLEREGEFVVINVGSIDHPMDEDHYIELVQLLHNGKIVKEKHLKPGCKPRAKFYCKHDMSELSARAYCNKHGLWAN